MESSETLPASPPESDQVDQLPEEKPADPSTNQLDSFTDDDDFGDFEDGGDFQAAADPTPITASIPSPNNNNDDNLLNLSFHDFHLSASQILSNIQLSPLSNSYESSSLLIPLHQLVAQSQLPSLSKTNNSSRRRLSWHGSHAEARFLEFLGLKKNYGGTVSVPTGPAVIEPVEKMEEEGEAEVNITALPPSSCIDQQEEEEEPEEEELTDFVVQQQEEEQAPKEEEEMFTDFVAQEEGQPQVQQEMVEEEEECTDSVVLPRQEEELAVDTMVMEEQKKSVGAIEQQHPTIDNGDFVGLPPPIVKEVDDVWQSSAALDCGENNQEEEEERWHSIQDMNGSFADGAAADDDDDVPVVGAGDEVNNEDDVGIEESKDGEKMEEPQKQEEEEEFVDFAAVDPIEAVVSRLHDLSFMLQDKIQGPQ